MIYLTIIAVTISLVMLVWVGLFSEEIDPNYSRNQAPKRGDEYEEDGSL